ncbi:glycosyltransferase family 25 protein [Vibrio astriarenae]
MIKTFIIHVSKGYEDRKEHIERHLPQRGITEFEYMLKGDIDDLSDEIRNEFFRPSMHLPAKSCFYKHYLVMKKVVTESIPQVLVLEDDAILDPKFCHHLDNVLRELEGQNGYIVNLEEASSLVPIWYRKQGQTLYLSEINKLAGGLVYDLEYAKKMVNYIESTIQLSPIDQTIGKVRHAIAANLYWVHPPIVGQGSKSGMFSSELSGKRAGKYTALRAFFKDVYKMHVLSNLKSSHLAFFKNVKRY